MNNKVIRILDTFEDLYPDAHCELIHKDAFELLIAVSLSAQTTDQRVNAVTPALFLRYPDCYKLADADIREVENIIHSIGLYHNKAKNIIAISKDLVNKYNGTVPNNRKKLMTLDGVGRKTANVVLSVAFDVPTLAVDTHVARVSKRLGLAKYDDDVLKIEEKLCKRIDKKLWNKTHHQMIFFGRYFCKAKNPNCDNCPLIDICKRKKYEK